LVVAFVLQDLFSRGSNDIYSADKTQPDGVDAWIHIGEDGTVKVFTGKVEVGQNIRTSLSQIVAEELMVPMSSVTMIMGDTHQHSYQRESELRIFDRRKTIADEDFRQCTSDRS